MKRIERGEPITTPGGPKNYPDAKQRVTTDCINPMGLNKTRSAWRRLRVCLCRGWPDKQEF